MVCNREGSGRAPIFIFISSLLYFRVPQEIFGVLCCLVTRLVLGASGGGPSRLADKCRPTDPRLWSVGSLYPLEWFRIMYTPRNSYRLGVICLVLKLPRGLLT